MKPKYLLVDAAALPDVFLRVVQAKQLLAQGKVKNLSEAAEKMDISRSTFYKYKDCVFTYEPETDRRIANIYAELEDRSGVLSALLTGLYARGGNILTINQNIPVDGVAPVSISMRTDHMAESLEEAAESLRLLDGVVAFRILSG